MSYNFSNFPSQLIKRHSSVERQLVSTLKTDSEGIISLSDVDDEEINGMILNEEESRLKKVIWDNLNREWIKA